MILALAMMAMGLGSCAAPTDVTVRVKTDFACTDLHHVTITVGSLGRKLETDRWMTASASCENGAYVGQVVLAPSGSKSDVVAIKVIGAYRGTKNAEACVATYDAANLPQYGAGCIVARRALRYTPHVPLVVPVILHAQCDGVSCREDQTCVANGACVTARIADGSACGGGGGCDESVLGVGPAAGDAGATDDASLAAPDGLLALGVSAGTLSPAFDPATFSYANVPSVISLGAPFTVTAMLASGASATINGAAAGSGVPSTPIPLNLLTPTAIDITVTTRAGGQRHYAVAVPPVQETYLKASNTGAGASYGASVALSGNTLAVGAVGESSKATGVNGDATDTTAPGAGAVYVFTRSGSTWSQQAYLKASNTLSGAHFGFSVALSGDTLAVGSTYESSSGPQTDASAPASGAVYVFTRSAGAWSQQAYVKASTISAGAFFGYSVALSGDTLAVGAIGEFGSAVGVNGNQSPSNYGSGAAYVFTRSGTTWSQQAYVKASNTRVGANFGCSVTLFGETLAVGALSESSNASGVDGNGDDSSASNAGAVYVFTRKGVTWSQQAYIKASNTPTQTSANFGAAVRLWGDSLAVGAPGESTGTKGIDGDQTAGKAQGAGAVYVFTRSGARWSQKAYIKASNTAAGAAFGGSVDLVGDMLVVGSDHEGSSASGVNGSQLDAMSPGVGAVYVFERSGATWLQQAYVKASNPRTNAWFGGAVAVSNDSLVVGSYGESSSAIGANEDQRDASFPYAGAVYVLR